MGDLGSIPGSGRSPGEGNGNPLQYSWASLVAQLVKNPPATQETWVPSLGWEDPLEKGKATHSVFWPGEVYGVAKSRTQLRDFHFLIRSNTSIITLNVNELNAPTKGYRLAEQTKTCVCRPFPLTTSLCLTPQTVCHYFILLG